MSERFALIVEDDPEFALYISRALQALSFETEVVDNGGRALERLTQIKPALIILDMHLPVFSGDNVLRQIHDDQTLIDTRVIIATADRALAEEYEGQADRIMVKPIHLEAFQAAIRQMFFIPE